MFPRKKINIFDVLIEHPIELFDLWLEQAKRTEINDPNAMALATVDVNGMPSVRMVLLKGHDENGFTFYTNFNSRKGVSLQANPKAALCFYWKSLYKQIRIEGTVEPVSDDIADAYYNSRDRISRISAWASHQSEPLARYAELKERVNFYEEKFKNQEVIPRPQHWSGFKVTPARFEFWEQGQGRLHNRFELIQNERDEWVEQRLNP